MNTPERIQELMTRASSGDAGAQNDLGCAYHNGDGVQRDYSTARLWYEKAARQNNAFAHSNLAILYENGFGVEKNNNLAFEHRLKAAELGNTGAMNSVARYYRYGYDPVDKDLAKAFEWYSKSAEMGDAYAAESLGIFYDYGYGCTRDYFQAVKWYRVAAEKGLRVAQNNLGSKYQNGQGVERDYDQAFFWYKKAATQGEEYAECNIGICYLEGKGVRASKKEAYYWFKKSAEHNHERAKTKLKELLDSGYDPNKDKTIFSVDIVSKNPFRILGTYVNASVRDIQANKTKINAFLSVGNNPDFPSDHLMMDEKCPTQFDEDNEPIFVPRDEQSINNALAAINIPADKVKYSLFWFANVTPIDDLALNHISDNIEIDEATLLWDKKETFSSLLNKGLMNLCAGFIEPAVDNYTELLHNEAYRNDFLKATVGDTFFIGEDELSHLFIDTLLDQFPGEDWRAAFELEGKSCDDDDYIASKLTEGPIRIIENAIGEAKKVDRDSALPNYNASKRLRDTTRTSLRELGDLMGKNSAQYQMLVDKLANQILQNAINYFNSSDDDDAPLKAMELQKYALSIAVGKMVKDRCAQNVSILQGIIDKLPPAEIRSAISRIHSALKRYSVKAKENATGNKFGSGTTSSKDAAFRSISGLFGPSITPVSPMIESIIKDIVFIREKMGPKNSDYINIATEVSVVALGITIDNVNNAQKSTSPYSSFSVSSKIRDAVSDAVKVVKYIQLMGPDQEFLSKRLEPNKQTLDKMATSFAVFASVDERTFFTESEYYNSSHTKSELQAFINKYPTGSHAPAARKKISEIEALEKQLSQVTDITECQNIYNGRQRDGVCDTLIDDKCFSLVKNRETDCRKYLVTFSKHKDEVRAKLKTVHKWWWALGIVDAVLLGCLLLPGTIAIPIVIGVIALIVDACV